MTRASPRLRGTLALAVLATFGSGAVAALDVPSWIARHGLSNFGRPPELGLAAGVVALLGAAWLLWPTPRDRRDVARAATLLVVVATLLGGRLVPNDGALRLVLAAGALWAAAPWLRASRPSTIVAALCVVAALPAVASTLYPHGSVLWLVRIAPLVAVAACLPAVFGSPRVPALVVACAAGLAGVVSASSYPIAAAELGLSTATLLSTRLTVLGLHPNLAVPLLAVGATLAVGLVLAGPRRALPALALAAIAATLVGVASRTGFLVTGLGVGLVVAWTLARRRERLAGPARVAWWLLVVVLAVGAVVPATDWTSATITNRSSSMASKAVTFRSAMWELGRDTWDAAPWHGHGPGTLYEQAAVARPGRYDGMPKDDHPHNVVLLVGAALGFPGLAAALLLFVATARPPRRPDELALAAAAAAMWAANTIDLGGAVATMYPALAFVLLGLRDARDDDAPARTRSAPARVVGGAALVALAAVGVVLSVQRALVADAAPRAEALAGPGPEAEAVDAALARADALLPTDPDVAWTRARLAVAADRPGEALAHVEQALARFPRSAFLHHERAKLLMLTGAEADGVEAALDEALALDAYGPDAWRRHLDRARVAASRGDEDRARAALIAAFLANPSAAGDVDVVGFDDARAFAPAGPRGARVPVADVLADLAAQRERWQATDLAYATRFDLRGVEVLRAIGAHAEADAAARAMDTPDRAPYYEFLMRARAASAAGRHDDAVALFEQANESYTDSLDADQAGATIHPHVLVDEVGARSRAESLDVETFARRSALVADVIGDLRFETDAFRRWLDARRRVAERTGDAAEAARLTEALRYLDR